MNLWLKGICLLIKLNFYQVKLLLKLNLIGEGYVWGLGGREVQSRTRRTATAIGVHGKLRKATEKLDRSLQKHPSNHHLFSTILACSIVSQARPEKERERERDEMRWDEIWQFGGENLSLVVGPPLSNKAVRSGPFRTGRIPPGSTISCVNRVPFFVVLILVRTCYFFLFDPSYVHTHCCDHWLQSAWSGFRVSAVKFIVIAIMQISNWQSWNLIRYYLHI